MKTFWIWMAVLLVLFLIGQVRVGIRSVYDTDGLTLWARLGWIKLTVFPRPEKEKKPKQDKAKEKPTPEKKPAPQEKKEVPLSERAGGALEYAKALLPIVLEAAAQFRRKLRVDKLHLVLTVGGEDPADVAMLYGQANMIIGSFWYPLTEAVHVKDGTAKVQMDFNAGGSTIAAEAALSLKIVQILWLGIHFGGKAFLTFLRVQKEQKKLKQIGKAA